MMAIFKKFRNPKIAILMSGMSAIMLLLLCLSTFLFLRTTLPYFYKTPAIRIPIVWERLPAPTKLNLQWTSYPTSQKVNDLVRHGELLWMATDSGLIVWDSRTAESVHFLSEHGLPSNRLTAVDIAVDGRVWVGSVDSGIGEFDGLRWQLHTTSDGLPSNRINDIAADSNGVIWVATDQGIARFDGSVWTPIRASLFDYSPASARALLVNSGGVWAATSEGLLFFNGTRWQRYTAADGLLNDNVFALSMTPDGTLWVGTETGLASFDGRNWRRFTVRDGLRNIPIQAVAGAPDNSVWFAYADALGMSQFDGGRITRSVDEKSGLASNSVQKITADSARFWVATDQGVDLWDLTTNDWSQVKIFENSRVLPQQINVIAEAEGSIWVGGRGGIARFDGVSWRNFSKEDGLTDEDVFGLFAASDGRLHAAFERPSSGIATFSEGQWVPTACENGLPNVENLHSGAVAPDGSVWLVGNLGVARASMGNNGVSTWQLFSDGWPMDALPRGLGITPEGEVWVAMIQGLYRLDQVSGRWERVSEDHFQRLSIAPNGELWAATDTGVVQWVGGQLVEIAPPELPDLGDFLATDNGLWISSSGGVGQLTDHGWRIHTTRDGLLGNEVVTLGLDDQGRVWSGYGSAKLGFSYFDVSAGLSGRWQTVRNSYELMPDGLLSNNVMDILVAPEGQTWFASPEGLSRYDIHTDSWFTYQSRLPVEQIVYAVGSVWVRTARSTYHVEDNQLSQHGMLFDRTDYLTADLAGRLWAFDTSSPSPRISIFDGTVWQTKNLPEALDGIKDVAFEQDGRIWLLASRDGADHLYVFSEPGWQEIVLPIAGAIAAMSLDDLGVIWLGERETGLLQPFQLNDFLELQPVASSPLLSGRVLYFELAVDGTLWAVTQHNEREIKVHYVSEEGWMAIEETDLPFQLDRTRIQGMTTAQDGAVWLATTAGAARYLEGKWELVTAPSDETSPHTLRGTLVSQQNSVTQLLVNEAHEIWFGTAHGDVGRLSSQGLLPKPNDPRVSWGEVRVLVEDNEGGVWVGSYDGRVARFVNGEWQRFDTKLSTAAVRTLVTTAGANWLGTNEGVVRLDQSGCEFLPNRLSLDIVSGVADFDEAVWWGSSNEGLFRYVDRFETPVVNLIGRNIQALTIGPDGTIWAAEDNRLTRFSYEQRDEIPVEGMLSQAEISAVAVGPTGRPWVGTTAGITFPGGSGWEVLTAADGLADNHITHMLTASDGTFWFVTQGGLSHYRPVIDPNWYQGYRTHYLYHSRGACVILFSLIHPYRLQTL